jgi:SAM-dependent methyltransferase
MFSRVDNPAFWEEKYGNGLAGWDMKTPNPVFTRILQEGKFIKPCEILIPGCGKGYDAVEAAKAGYNVTAIDFAPSALSAARSLAEKEGVKLNFVEDDIFALNDNYLQKFDAVYEYTTFCAVNPPRREEYIEKLFSYLKTGGVLLALLFPVEKKEGGPPFGIDVNEFYRLASKYCDLLFSSRKINSIKPRRGREVLQVYIKK